MSQENVEIVRKVYDAIARGDSEAVLENYDPDVELDFSESPFATVSRQKVYRGHGGIRALTRERYEEAWKSIDDDLLDLIDAHGQVVAVVKTVGRGRTSDVKVDRTHAAVWTIQDGKITRVAWYRSGAEALEAAGLSE